jgi:hypothetical protein
MRYNVQDVSDILDCLDMWLKEHGYGKAILKITSDLFSQEKTDLLEYLLWNRGYKQYTELSSYIDFLSYSPDLLSNIKYTRKSDIKKCIKYSLEGKFLDKPDEIEGFYDILCGNLLKYDAKPVHTIDELFDIKKRLNEAVLFYGIYDHDKMVAGAMLFFFKNSHTIHTQYFCAKQDIREYAPMTFLIYKLIEFSKTLDSKFLSFGISTEEKGRILNMGLIKAKEAYGAKFSLNRTFYKEM